MTAIPAPTTTTHILSVLVQNKPGYREYMQQTSAFIPWMPRKNPHADAPE